MLCHLRIICLKVIPLVRLKKLDIFLQESSQLRKQLPPGFFRSRPDSNFTFRLNRHEVKDGSSFDRLFSRFAAYRQLDQK